MPSNTAKYSKVDRFAGLSDRQVPVGVTRIESPDIRNVDLHEGTLKRRRGYQRMHANILRDCSLRLNGANPLSNQLGQYVRIPNVSGSYAPSNKLFLCIDVVMRGVRDPGASPDESFIISRGSGTGAARYLSISYDPDTPGWTLRARDGGSDRVATLTDGSSSQDIVNEYRRLEVECTTIGTDTYTFRALNSAGTVIDSDTFVVGTWLADGALGSATGWVLGADQNSSGAALTNTFSSVTLANFALWDSSSQPTYFGVSAAARVERELDNSPVSTDEFTGLDGYWILNDGKGRTLVDSSTVGNDGVLAGEGPEWVSDPALGPGPSSLEFFGEDGAVRWRTGTLTTDVFGTATYSARRWAATFVFVPRMDQGETTVRDQTLVWTGTSNTTPAPFGAVIDSTTHTANRLTILYKDGTSVKAAEVPVNLSTLVNKRLRVWVSHHDLAGGDQFTAYIVDMDAAAFTQYASTSTATAGTTAGTLSGSVTVGRLMTSLVLPFAYDGFNTQGSNAARAVVSDLAFFRVQSSTQGFGPFMNQGTTSAGLSPNSQLSTSPATFNQTMSTSSTETIQLVGGLPLDDGEGTRPRTFGTTVTNAAYLIPESEAGVLWDIGITDPLDPPEIDGIFDYRRATNDGNFQRSLLVVSGCTLYEITGLEEGIGAATATPVGAGLHKGGKCTFSQLGNTVYIGRPNGKRPRKWNGTYLDWVGIEAPAHAPEGSGASASGSLTASGTYYVYVTYRNKETGVESNPSPGAAITLGGGHDAIGTLQIPVSPDPQVNQRRIWISPLAAAEDAMPIYLAENASGEAVIDDNTAITYTTGITVVDIANAAITDIDANSAPPAGSLVRSFKDRLWVSGNPLAPTQLHYSKVLTPDQFDGSDYLELDQDTGDRITGLGRLLNRMVVFLRDGRIQITDSGNDAAPFFATVASRDSGSVGPQGHTEYEGIIPYISEHDIFLWDGGQALNISSPTDPERPSIQDTMRNNLNPARRGDACAMVYRLKDQLWFACSSSGSSRNDMILVFDFEGGAWSRYDMDVDCLAQVEDGNDASLLYGGVRGHLCRLDKGDYDGPVSLAAGTATSGDTESLTDSGAPFTAGQNKGMYAVWYDVSADVVQSARIRDNSTSKLLFYDAVTAPVSGDPYVIGGVSWYADFVADFGTPMRQKKLHWFRAALDSSLDANRARVTIVANHPQRDSSSSPWNASGNSPQEVTSLIPAADKYWLADVGGVGQSFRLRISDSAYASPASEQAVPSAGRIDFFEFELEAEELETQ